MRERARRRRVRGRRRHVGRMRVLRFATVEVGTGAPLGCVRCSSASAPGYYESDAVIERVAAVADSWGDPPGPNVILCGPEPFAHPGLPAIVAACANRGVERICIETDGGALSVGANAEGALDAGVRHLRVRLPAAVAPAGDDLAGRPGLVRDARSGVRAFLEAGEAGGVDVVVTAVVPVCSHTLDLLPASVAELASWGVHAVRLVSAGALPNDAAVHLAAACDTGMVNRVWVETDGALPLPESHALHAVDEAGDDG